MHWGKTHPHTKCPETLGINETGLSKWVKKFKQEGSCVFGQEDTETKRLQTKVKRVFRVKEIF